MIFEFGADPLMELCLFYTSIVGYIVGFSDKLPDLKQIGGMVLQFQMPALLLVSRKLASLHELLDV